MKTEPSELARTFEGNLMTDVQFKFRDQFSKPLFRGKKQEQMTLHDLLVGYLDSQAKGYTNLASAYEKLIRDFTPSPQAGIRPHTQQKTASLACRGVALSLAMASTFLT